jgi:hypothetical protein
MAEVSFPQINTYPIHPPIIDFSQLANLPNAFWQGQKQARQNAINNAIKSIPVGPNGSIDLGAAAKSLMAAGDYPDALAASQSATGASQFSQIGTDALGNPRYGFVNLKQQNVSPLEGQAGAGGNTAALGNSNVYGEDFLAASGLPENVKANIRAIARGDQLPPSTNRPQGNALMGLVNQFDPTFSQAIAPTRMQTRKAFATGTQGQAVTALNTLPGHLQALSTDVDSLGGWDTSLGAVNRYLNAGRNWLNRGGSDASGQALAKINSDMTAVAEELERVWRGSGGNVTEIEDWKRNFDLADGPTAKHAALSRLSGLVQSRVDALKDQYARGMGTDRYAIEIGGSKVDPNLLVRPEDQQILDTLSSGGRLPPESSVANSSGSESATAVNPKTGHVIVKRNGQWVDAKTGAPLQ